MKSYAPSFIAATAVSTFPKAVMTRTGTSGEPARTFRSTSIPEMPGIFRSVITRSKGDAEKGERPSRPSAAGIVSYPAFRRLNSATSRPAGSSSMNRIRPGMAPSQGGLRAPPGRTHYPVLEPGTQENGPVSHTACTFDPGKPPQDDPALRMAPHDVHHFSSGGFIVRKPR